MAKKEKNEFVNEELDEMYEDDKFNTEDLTNIPDDLDEEIEQGEDDPEMTINDNGTYYYEVQKGDNIYSIASMFNIDYKKLYQDNKDVIGTNMNYIEVGMMLLIDKN